MMRQNILQRSIPLVQMAIAQNILDMSRPIPIKIVTVQNMRNQPSIVILDFLARILNGMSDYVVLIAVEAIGIQDVDRAGKVFFLKLKRIMRVQKMAGNSKKKNSPKTSIDDSAISSEP